MTRKIFINFKFPISVRKKGKWYIATCPALDVCTQGETGQKAKANLNDAVSLFITSCLERQTLDAVLKKCGFVLSAAKAQSYKNNYLEVPIPFTQKSPATCHA
jgi:predicted RNase H-like HicB family nuclease